MGMTSIGTAGLGPQFDQADWYLPNSGTALDAVPAAMPPATQAQTPAQPATQPAWSTDFYADGGD